MTLGALVRDPRVAPNAKRMVARSVSLTEKIAIEKISLTPSSGETDGAVAPRAHVGQGPRGVQSLKVSSISRAPFGRHSTSKKSRNGPIGKMHVPDIANSCYIRAPAPGKNTDDGVG